MLSKTEARWLAQKAVTFCSAKRVKGVYITQTRTESQLTIKVHLEPLNSKEMEEGETHIFTKEELI